MSKKVYKEESGNIHSITQSGDFLCLSNAASGTKVDVKKHLKSLAGGVLLTFSGNSTVNYIISVKINPIVKTRTRAIETKDKINISWDNPNSLEYTIQMNGNSTWNSKSVFGKIPIHSFQLLTDGSLVDGIDIIFIPESFQ